MDSDITILKLKNSKSSRNMKRKKKTSSKIEKLFYIMKNFIVIIFLIFCAYMLFCNNIIIVDNKKKINELLTITKTYQNYQNNPSQKKENVDNTSILNNKSRNQKSEKTNTIILNNTISENGNNNNELNNITSENVINNALNNTVDKTVEEKIKMLKIITNNNKYLYEGAERCLLNDPDSQYCIYHLIAPKKVIGKQKILNGVKRDGSYVTLDDFKDIKIAYSFGIEYNIIFDKSLVERGIDVYMYDHTISSLPKLTQNNSKYHWEKIGITGKNQTNPYLKTLEELMARNGHMSEKNMILKMDVENCEWDSLKDVPEEVLKQFKYILMELHFETKDTELYYNVLKKLSKNHQVFHLRCNNRKVIVTFGNNRICKYLEVSYVIKENNTFDVDDTIYPVYEFDFEEAKPYSYGSEMNLNILKVF